MRRFLVSVVVAAALVIPTTALAASPHFINASSGLSGSNLIASWKEAGLGDNQNIDYLLSADGSATYVCVNGGGNKPSAQNKTTVNGPVTATGSFASDKNGSITGSLSAGPPSAGSFTCPGGQALNLAQVSFTNVRLADTTNGITVTLADQSSGCLLPNVKNACD